MSKVYPALLKRLTIRLKRSAVWIFNYFLISVYQISIEFWIRNALLQKFLQTDMIFFDQLKVPSTIKFGKCFSDFMIPIALLKKFGS